ncbi:MAG: tRNA pseudouridine synthase A [Saprospiraceae bacterium]|nr:tRNA pseudouridine synthase A [Saprospiraceae bacterium]
MEPTYLMPMRYFGSISYDGSKFFGWQKQTNSQNTIQHHLDHCLSVLLRENIETVGCGRTDAGVHASGYYFHFDCTTAVEAKALLYHANQILPPEIVLHTVFQVGEQLHARFDAIHRSYVYRIKTIKNPFDAFHTFYAHDEVMQQQDILQKLAAMIGETSDFKHFCKTGSDVTSYTCVVSHSEWKFDQENHSYEYHITANRFLRGMIRLLVGMMLNAGRVN